MENNEVMMLEEEVVNNEVTEVTEKKGPNGLLIAGGIAIGVCVIGKILWKKVFQPKLDKAIEEAVARIQENGFDADRCEDCDTEEDINE